MIQYKIYDLTTIVLKYSCDVLECIYVLFSPEKSGKEMLPRGQGQEMLPRGKGEAIFDKLCN